jgi:hypothetical protein
MDFPAISPLGPTQAHHTEGALLLHGAADERRL